MQNLKTSLSCTWQANGSQSQFIIENFHIDSDQSVTAKGVDQCGAYHYSGKVESDGTITITRVYTNLPTVMPLNFQGKINKDSTITGVVTNQGVNSGTFTFRPTLK